MIMNALGFLVLQFVKVLCIFQRIIKRFPLTAAAVSVVVGWIAGGA